MRYEVDYYAPMDIRKQVEEFLDQDKALARAEELRNDVTKAIGGTVEVFEVTRRKIG